MPRRIDGLALGAVAAGGLFAYAGIRGYSVPHALQALVQGQPPSAGGQANPITAPVIPAGTPGGGAGHVRTAGGAATQTSWSKSLLATMGLPQTQANIDSLNAWQQAEGGGGANNPLNTTWPEPGATDFNSVGVKNYTSVQQGLQATAATLTSGYYGDIMMHLRSGQGFLGVTLQGLSTWSGGGYSSVG